MNYCGNLQRTVQMVQVWLENFRGKAENPLKNLLRPLNILNFKSVVLVSWDSRIGCDQEGFFSPSVHRIWICGPEGDKAVPCADNQTCNVKDSPSCHCFGGMKGSWGIAEVCHCERPWNSIGEDTAQVHLELQNFWDVSTMGCPPRTVAGVERGSLSIGESLYVFGWKRRRNGAAKFP